MDVMNKHVIGGEVYLSVKKGLILLAQQAVSGKLIQDTWAQLEARY